MSLVRSVALAALALLAACSSSPAHRAPASDPGASTAVGYADNGRTVTIARGSQLVVTLPSTYWNFDALTSRAILASSPTYDPAGGGHRIPGSGAGTVREVLRAVGAGSATVVAHRSSCGEAMRCVGGLGTFRVTVVVR